MNCNNSVVYIRTRSNRITSFFLLFLLLLAISRDYRLYYPLHNSNPSSNPIFRCFSARTRGVARSTPSIIWLSLLLTLGTRTTASATNMTNVSPLASTVRPITTTEVVYQRFAIEPMDQTAVIGSRVTLPCRVLDQKGPIQWTKDDFGLGAVRNLTGYERYAMIGSDEEGKRRNLHTITPPERSYWIDFVKVIPPLSPFSLFSLSLSFVPARYRF